MVGVPIKSEYVPVFAILCKLIDPDNASEELVDNAVVLVVLNVPGAEGIVGFPTRSEYVPVFATL